MIRLLSFFCRACLRPWSETPGFTGGMHPSMLGRCPYCPSRNIEKR